jgi:hypothetical protein
MQRTVQNCECVNYCVQTVIFIRFFRFGVVCVNFVPVIIIIIIIIIICDAFSILVPYFALRLSVLILLTYVSYISLLRTAVLGLLCYLS